MHDGSHAKRANEKASLFAKLVNGADVARGERSPNVVGGEGGGGRLTVPEVILFVTVSPLMSMHMMVPA